MKSPKEKTTNISETIFNWSQACLHFKINGINRLVVERKFKKENLTLDEWEICLKKNKLLV